MPALLERCRRQQHRTWLQSTSITESSALTSRHAPHYCEPDREVSSSVWQLSCRARQFAALSSIIWAYRSASQKTVHRRTESSSNVSSMSKRLDVGLGPDSSTRSAPLTGCLKT